MKREGIEFCHMLIDAPVGGIGDLDPLAGAGDADIGEAALLLQPGGAVLVEGALAGEQPFLPAGQEDRVELQPLGAVQGHDTDHVARIALGILHHQADMLEEAGEALELGHGIDQLLQILQPARRIGRFVRLEHAGIAGSRRARSRRARHGACLRHGAPALEIADQAAERAARRRLQLVGLDQPGGRRRSSGRPCAAASRMQLAHGGVADAAARRVDDALEGEVVVRLVDQAQIGDARRGSPGARRSASPPTTL